MQITPIDLQGLAALDSRGAQTYTANANHYHLALLALNPNPWGYR